MKQMGQYWRPPARRVFLPPRLRTHGVVEVGGSCCSSSLQTGSRVEALSCPSQMPTCIQRSSKGKVQAPKSQSRVHTRRAGHSNCAISRGSQAWQSEQRISQDEKSSSGRKVGTRGQRGSTGQAPACQRYLACICGAPEALGRCTPCQFEWPHAHSQESLLLHAQYYRWFA